MYLLGGLLLADDILGSGHIREPHSWADEVDLLLDKLGPLLGSLGQLGAFHGHEVLLLLLARQRRVDPRQLDLLRRRCRRLRRRAGPMVVGGLAVAAMAGVVLILGVRLGQRHDHPTGLRHPVRRRPLLLLLRLRRRRRLLAGSDHHHAVKFKHSNKSKLATTAVDAGHNNKNRNFFLCFYQSIYLSSSGCKSSQVKWWMQMK
jgi:hypothetical protein